MSTATIAETHVAQGESASSPPRPRLVPGTPVLWRGPDILQIGFTLAIRQAPRAARTALGLLDGSHTVARAAAAARVDPAWLHLCVRTLDEAGLLASPVAGCIAVVGHGALADVAADALGTLRVLRGEGPWPEPPAAVLLAADVHTADRSLTRRLTRGRTPHLYAGATPGGASVGPFVVPGESACQRCADLSLAGRDTSWPQLAAQLDAARLAPDPAPALWAAGLAVTHVRAFLAGRAPESVGRTWELVDGQVRVRRWALHPECDCGVSAA